MTNVKKTRKLTTLLMSNIRDCKKPTTELLVHSVEQDHTKSGYLIYGRRTLPFTLTVVLSVVLTAYGNILYIRMSHDKCDTSTAGDSWGCVIPLVFGVCLDYCFIDL